MDQMEARGIVSAPEGSKPREVLMTKEKMDRTKYTTTSRRIKERRKQMRPLLKKIGKSK